MPVETDRKYKKKTNNSEYICLYFSVNFCHVITENFNLRGNFEKSKEHTFWVEILWSDTAHTGLRVHTSHSMLERSHNLVGIKIVKNQQNVTIYLSIQ